MLSLPNCALLELLTSTNTAQLERVLEHQNFRRKTRTRVTLRRFPLHLAQHSAVQSLHYNTGLCTVIIQFRYSARMIPRRPRGEGEKDFHYRLVYSY